jgi:hypothetical protein
MQNHTKISLAVALGCTLLLASTAQAQTFKLSLGGSDSAVTDDSYDYAGEGPFLSLGQFGAEFSPLEGLWLGAEYQWGEANGDAVDQIYLNTQIDGALATARYEVTPLPFLSAYGRVGGGFMLLDMEADVQLQNYSQARYIGVGEGALGVEVFLPRGTLGRVFGFSRRAWASQMTVGILLEAGYRLTSEASFDDLERPNSSGDEDNVAIETNTLDLGSMDLSGVMMRSALTLSF